MAKKICLRVFNRYCRLSNNFLIDEFIYFIIISIYVFQSHIHLRQHLYIIIVRMCCKKGSCLFVIFHCNILTKLVVFQSGRHAEEGSEGDRDDSATVGVDLDYIFLYDGSDGFTWLHGKKLGSFRGKKLGGLKV